MTTLSSLKARLTLTTWVLNRCSLLNPLIRSRRHFRREASHSSSSLTTSSQLTAIAKTKDLNQAMEFIRHQELFLDYRLIRSGTHSCRTLLKSSKSGKNHKEGVLDSHHKKVTIRKLFPQKATGSQLQQQRNNIHLSRQEEAQTRSLKFQTVNTKTAWTTSPTQWCVERCSYPQGLTTNMKTISMEPM